MKCTLQYIKKLDRPNVQCNPLHTKQQHATIIGRNNAN